MAHEVRRVLGGWAVFPKGAPAASPGETRPMPRHLAEIECQNLNAQEQRDALRANPQGVSLAAKVSKTSVNYRPSTQPLRRCGMCDMFEGGSCTLVAGHIEPDMVCDRFEARHK